MLLSIRLRHFRHAAFELKHTTTITTATKLKEKKNEEKFQTATG